MLTAADLEDVPWCFKGQTLYAPGRNEKREFVWLKCTVVEAFGDAAMLERDGTHNLFSLNDLKKVKEPANGPG